MAGAAVFGAGYGATQNLTLVAAFARAGENGTTTASAMWNASFDAGTATGALALGFLAAGIGLDWTYVVVAAFLTLPLLVGQLEHKAMAHMQARLGPMYAGGFHGWAQLVADGVKFAQKEAVVPDGADRRVFQIAPALALVPYLVVMVAIPLGPGLVGLRTAAQLLAYELPFVLAAASAAMAAGTLSLSGIVAAWEPWWLIWQAPAAVVFFVAGLAELHRPPFDAPVADSEIIMGALTEYGGLRFALFLLAEYAGIVVLSLLTTVLFLGGWSGPFADQLGWVWTLAKALVLAFLVIWARVSFPRLRADQLQRLCWVVLVPVALAQLALTGVVRVVLA